MAFPTIPTTASGDLLSTATTTASTTHTFPNLSSLRGGAGPQAGDLIIAVCVQYQGGTASNQFSAWGASLTEIADLSTVTALDEAIGVAYKVASGSESGTFTVTSANAFMSSNFLMRIPAGTWHGTTAPEVSAAVRATGAVADPASLDPTNWAAEDTLWIGVYGHSETTTTGSPPVITTEPTNYSGALIVARGADAVGNITGAVAFRQNNASSEDAGVWTVTNPTRGNGIAATIAVRPIPPTATAVARISLAAGTTPSTRTLHNIKARVRATGAGTVTFSAALYEGANNRSGNLTTGALTTSLADYTLAIADASAANITDYSDLELRIWGNSSSGATVNVEVADVWLEVPETAAPADLPLATAAATSSATLAVSAGPPVIPLGSASAQSSATLGLYVPGATYSTGTYGSGTYGDLTPTVGAPEVPLATAVATSNATLALKAQTQVPLQTSPATSSATLALKAQTTVALQASPATSNATLALKAQTRIPLQSSDAVSAGTLAITSGVPLVPLQQADAVSTGTLALRAQTRVVLGTSPAQSAATLALTAPTIVQLDRTSGGRAVQIDPDGAWSFFNDPHVICQRAAGADWMHVGHVASNGDVQVRSVDLETETTVTSTLRAAMELDDHGPVSLCVMGDDTLFATYSRHGTAPIYLRRTVDPADPTSWDVETSEAPTLPGGTGEVTYPKPVRFAANGRIYVFYRADFGSAAFFYSDDDGASWSSALPFISNGSERPYLNIQYDSVGDQLDVLYTDGHPRNEQNSMWHVTVDPNGDVRKSDGTLIRNVVTGAEVEFFEGTRIYAPNDVVGRGWGWNVCRDPADNTVIYAVFARYQDDLERDHRYAYARYDDGRWQVNADVLGQTAGYAVFGTAGWDADYPPVSEGHYSGGVHLDKATPGTVYLSRLVQRGYPGLVVSSVVATPSYFGLDEPSGTTAKDVTSANDGTYVNTPTLGVSGALADGTAVEFVAANQEELTVPGPTMSTGGGVSFWFKWTSGTALMRDHTGVSGWILGYDSGGTFTVRVAAGDIATSKTTASVRDGNWHHFHVGKFSGTVNVYVDGVNVGSTGGAANTATTMPWHVGRNGTGSGGSDWSDCTIDGLAIGTSLVLTQAQVQEQVAARNLQDHWRIERWRQVGSGDYASEVLADSPTAYYRLGEPSGTNANDSAVGSSHDGTHVNTPTLDVTGALAADNDGGVTYSAASSERTTLTTLGTWGANAANCTIEFWLKTTATTKQCVMGTVDTGSSMIVAVWLNTNESEVQTAGQTLLQIRSNGGVGMLRTRIAAAHLYDGNWHHVVCRVDAADSATMYVDGSPQAVISGTGSGGVVDDANLEFPMALGCRNLRGVFDSHMDGSLDEVAFYPTRLSDQRIAAHYAAGAALKFSGEILDQGPGTKRLRPVGPSDPDVTDTRPPDAVWMSGTYTTYLTYNTAVFAEFASSFASLQLTVPTLVPLQASAGQSNASLALTANARPALSTAAATSSAALALTAQTYIPLGTSTGQSSATLTVTAVGAGLIPLQASAATSTATLALRAQTQVPLGASSATAAGTLALRAQTRIVLGTSAATSTGGHLVLFAFTSPVTHPPLGGVYDQTRTNGTVDELSRNGTVTEYQRGGVVTTYSRGGVVVAKVRSGRVVEHPRDGTVREVVRAGSHDESSTGGEVL